jgi:hypothetical protein
MEQRTSLISFDRDLIVLTGQCYCWGLSHAAAKALPESIFILQILCYRIAQSHFGGSFSRFLQAYRACLNFSTDWVEFHLMSQDFIKDSQPENQFFVLNLLI